MTRGNVLTFTPDPQDSSPIYLQVARLLAQTIRKGGYKPDEALPSERLLAENLNVSRATTRSAIDQLVEQGLIIRKRGSGNYIAPLLEQPLSRLTSLSEELERRGYTPSSRWLNRTVSMAMADCGISGYLCSITPCCGFIVGLNS